MKMSIVCLLPLVLLSNQANSSAVVEKIRQNQFRLKANFIYYGGSAELEHAEKITKRMEEIWTTNLRDCPVNFKAEFTSEVVPDDMNLKVKIASNTNALHNFVRLEKNNAGNVSFFILSGNSGMIVDKDLPEVSTTPAHEFGHSLGLDHPTEDEFLKQELPGLMYPRGTLVLNGYGRYDAEISKYLGPRYQGLDPLKRELKCFENLAVYRNIKLNQKTKKSEIGSAYPFYTTSDGQTQIIRLSRVRVFE